MESISVCSVCSKSFCSWERNVAVDEDVLKLLKFLFKKINYSALNIHICNDCLKFVQDAYNFKMLYLEKKTLNVALKMEQIDPEISCICQICKVIIKKSSSVPTTKVLKLMDCLTEEMQMGVEVTKDSRVCSSCEESIASFHSIVKLLSNFVENYKHKCNIKIKIEPSIGPSKIEIKQESSIEYDNIPNEHSMVKTEPLEIGNMKLDIKTESIHSNEVNLIYDDFIMKNEEVDIKSEWEESNSLDQMRKVNPWNVASKHFTVDHKNNEKTFGTIKIYNTSNIPKFMCDVCDYKAKQNCDLKRHMLQHMNADEIEMFTCDVCDYKAKRKYHMKTHMLKHRSVDEIEIFSCDVCDYKAKLKGHLKRHMLTHKSVDEIEMFTCNVCDYRTKRTGNLKPHMLKHMNVEEINMFACAVCDFKTKRKGDLKKHMLKHKNVAEIEMFSCEICDYKAKLKNHLTRHMLLQHKHVDEIEMFTCNVCDYKTKRKFDLKKHMLKHKNVDEIEMFACDVCNYKTKRKGTLKMHTLKHKNVDELVMFACDVCDYKAKYKSSLKIHKHTHKC